MPSQLNKIITIAIMVIAMAGCGSVTSYSHASMQVDYLPANSHDDKAALQAIKGSGVNDILIDLSADYFPFKNQLTIEYGGDQGPVYDPETHKIQIPYEFYTQSKAYFADNGYESRYGKSAEQGAIDTLLHTLLHESGHAYIAENQIPVLGKEEDAADDFATMMLLDYVQDGADIAISGADMFAFEADDVSLPDYYTPDEYVDEHSFDLQRYFSTLCLVYGSDPKTYAHLLDDISQERLAERQDFCQGRFEEVNYNWHQFLPE